MIDTLRRDHVGAYGYARDTTPFIDALAEAGLVFEDAVAQAPWTGASMASLWTSRLPSEVGGVVRPAPDGIRNLGRTSLLGLRPDVPTLAERLAAGGYRTLAAVSNAYAGSSLGLLRGFDAVFERPLAAGPLTDAVLVALDEALSAQPPGPVFLYVHYRDGHEPTWPPEPYRSLFPAGDGAPPAPEHARWRYGDAADPDAPEVQAFRRHKLALYDGALRYIDDQVRRIAERLAAAGALERTVFVVASDHGEEFWDHARLGRHVHVDPRGIAGIGHGHTLFAELLDVPLILSGAGLPARRVASQVRNLDLAPTLLGLAGLPAEDFEGRGVDLVAALDAERLEPLVAVSEEIAYGAGARSLEDGRYKLVRYERTRDGRTELLFDRAADPQERRDVLADNPEVARRLRQALEARTSATGASPGPAVELDASTRAELEALGYAP